MEPPSVDHCPVCGQTLNRPGGTCSNWLCNAPDRQFDKALAIAMKNGPLENAILSHKNGKWGWGIVFARVVLGYLYQYPEVTQRMDLIAPMPSYLAPGIARRGNDHAGWVIEQAMEQDDRGLPFALDPPVIHKTRPTPKMRHATSAADRRELARDIAAALVIPEPARIAGRTVMVYDDVFTGGNTLNAVAGVLKAAGAQTVVGLTLARQQWTTRT